MMIKRNVFEKLIKIHPEKQYINYDNEAIIEKQKNSKYYDFFSVGIDPDTKNYLSEDWYFCNLCSKAGIDIYMDLSIQLNHTGTYKFQGDILASNTLSVTTKTQKK